MQVNYKITIDNPHQHLVKVQLSGKRPKDSQDITFFLPVWSPGSYMVREYSRHIRSYRATNELGEPLYFEQLDKCHWSLRWGKLGDKKQSEEFCIEYEVYCREVSVRTSFVDLAHAFLHLPSLLMGVLDRELTNPVLEVIFPPIWSKISTGLKEISKKRDEFIYTAADYDQLIDCPIEIGCHETDGFMEKNVPHELAFFGPVYPHKQKMKDDIHKIVKTISDRMGGKLPYEKYVFITHFIPGIYGGLEHLNSTALHFDGTGLNDRKNYINWLCLVSHEYFHLWNVKRIRPQELGPFDYTKEAFTSMLWLAEGLTSFMDELFVFQSGLITLEEYLDLQKTNLERYLNVPGRRFHSLEESSLNAWIKLYRPDENTANTSVSYYLKGGIIFQLLHIKMVEKKKSINDLLAKLWANYLENPHAGLTKAQVFSMVHDIAGKEIGDWFETMVTTRECPDFEGILKQASVSIVWDQAPEAWLGINPEFKEGRAYVDSVVLDGPGYKSGLNAKDEILAINGTRILKDQFEKLPKILLKDTAYNFTVSRNGVLTELTVIPGTKPRTIKELKSENQEVTKSYFT